MKLRPFIALLLVPSVVFANADFSSQALAPGEIFAEKSFDASTSIAAKEDLGHVALSPAAQPAVVYKAVPPVHVIAVMTMPASDMASEIFGTVTDDYPTGHRGLVLELKKEMDDDGKTMDGELINIHYAGKSYSLEEFRKIGPSLFSKELAALQDRGEKKRPLTGWAIRTPHIYEWKQICRQKGVWLISQGAPVTSSYDGRSQDAMQDKFMALYENDFAGVMLRFRPSPLVPFEYDGFQEPSEYRPLADFFAPVEILMRDLDGKAHWLTWVEFEALPFGPNACCV